MEKGNAVLNQKSLVDDMTMSVNFDELTEKLDSQLEDSLGELEFLKEERCLIGNPDNLGKVIKNVVWEQLINQIAIIAGEDFI